MLRLLSLYFAATGTLSGAYICCWGRLVFLRWRTNTIRKAMRRRPRGSATPRAILAPVERDGAGDWGADAEGEVAVGDCKARLEVEVCEVVLTRSEDCQFICIIGAKSWAV